MHLDGEEGGALLPGAQSVTDKPAIGIPFLVSLLREGEVGLFANSKEPKRVGDVPAATT